MQTQSSKEYESRLMNFVVVWLTWVVGCLPTAPRSSECPFLRTAETAKRCWSCELRKQRYSKWPDLNR